MPEKDKKASTSSALTGRRRRWAFLKREMLQARYGKVIWYVKSFMSTNWLNTSRDQIKVEKSNRVNLMEDHGWRKEHQVDNGNRLKRVM